MNLEEQLRRTLTDERRALPGWDDPVHRVRTGMVRRRRRRILSVAAAVVSTLLAAPAAILVPVAVADPAWRIEDTIPWLHRGEPTPQPSAVACTAADLGPAASALVLGRADGAEHYQVTVRNGSAQACLLIDRPEPGSQESGAAQAVPTRPEADPEAGSDDTGAVPSVLLIPGAAASAELAASTECPDAAHPTVYRDLVLTFSGERLPLPGLTLTTTCVITVSTWSADRG
ncbi:hypothetical protein QEZ54_14310 [Catellatospora sp. KI3]|uniref:hypothetical protein n=1 Tax=Catellatospora sp. KI3 TaxID=3041620 RepID=UPI00248286CF|nr:hypothetical protein [Catellatospora sp. KI3]MDI1462143.1 hypothetical protein [Catellatospora sp. KI3]